MPSILGKLLLLPSALLALTISHALADVVEARAAQATTLPAPIAFNPDENWDGIDGSWSSFTLRIGTPAQTVRTFVSFASYQTWAVLPEGCVAASDQGACAMARGYTFNESASSTFDRIGIYELYVESNLGYDGNAIYGYDTVGLEGNGENGPTLQNTTVGGIAVEDFYLGVFGVNPKPTNFTSFNDPSPSYMTLLKEQKYIPSVSASYTAGAPYRFSGVLASLTLGGYDTSKFVPNEVEFTFAADNNRDILLAVQSIYTPSNNSANPVPTALLPGPIYAYIDSTVPQIWLPLEACQVFEAVFGLEYDSATELYLVNDTLHESLLQRNPNITFSLAQGLSGGSTVDITLPYAAFDLTASPPYQGLENATRYFPLRRAANDTQYTLGRTFLQEAYLTVNWEQQRFNVSSVEWNQNAETNLVAIPPGTGDTTSTTYPGTSTETPSSGSSGGLSGGAIGGIVVGVVALIALVAGLSFWFFRRRSRAAKAKAAQEEKLGENDSSTVRDSTIRDPDSPSTTRGRQENVFPKAELEGSSPMPPTPLHESDNKRLLSSHGSDPNTPGTLGAPSSVGYFHRPGSSGYSPVTPRDGEGTHSSTQSGSNNGTNGSGTHTSSSVLSPLSHSSEADSSRGPIFEMAGDMPTIREKDGKALSEKEAMARRERIYNGVDSAPTSAVAVSENGGNELPRVPPRTPIDPANVVRAGLHPDDGQSGLIRHRAFSFEEDRPPGERPSGEDSDELYE